MEFALRETVQKHLKQPHAEPQTQREPCTANGTADSRKEILSGNNSFANRRFWTLPFECHCRTILNEAKKINDPLNRVKKPFLRALKSTRICGKTCRLSASRTERGLVQPWVQRMSDLTNTVIGKTPSDAFYLRRR